MESISFKLGETPSVREEKGLNVLLWIWKKNLQKPGFDQASYELMVVGRQKHTYETPQIKFWAIKNHYQLFFKIKN